VLHQLTNALVMLSMVALEVLQQAETTSTQSNPPDLELLIHLISNMEESKLELSFQKVTGFGQLFGYFQKIMLMVDGLHLVKLIWLNQEETIVTEKLEVQTLSVQLFTLVQIGNMMLMKKLLKYKYTESLGNDFHVYGLEWNESGIKSTIDGNEVLDFPFDESLWSKGDFPEGMYNPW